MHTHLFEIILKRDKFIHGLAETDPDRFLYNFRDAFGQKQPDDVRPLGGWDSQTTRLRGHASGHYLAAIAQAYAGTTYDPELQANFLEKMNYMVDVLYDLSQKSGNPAEEGGEFNADPTAVPPGPGKEGYDSNLSEDGIRTDYWNWGKGFISAYPPDQFIMLELGATYGGRNNQIWAPYYTLHKILAGLLDCYEVGGNARALEIAEGMGLWVYARLKEVPTETRISMWNQDIAGEYGGMNEVMARLFRISGDPRFLECAKLFHNINFFFGTAEHSHGLAHNVDTIRGKHANQHIPQICTWHDLLGGTQYGETSPHFMGEIVSPGSVAWIWRHCTGRVLEGLATAPGGLGPNQTRRLIQEFRARQVMCDFGKWSGAYKALLDNNWGIAIDQEWSPYWIDCPTWTARCYVLTTNNSGTLTPEWRTLPGWSGANQIPLTTTSSTGNVTLQFTPLGPNLSCQLVYRATDNSVIYGKPVSSGTCSLTPPNGKAIKNNVVIAVICNTDFVYNGESSRTTKFDYRLGITGPGTSGVSGTANIAIRWYQ